MFQQNSIMTISLHQASAPRFIHTLMNLSAFLERR